MVDNSNPLKPEICLFLRAFPLISPRFLTVPSYLHASLTKRSPPEDAGRCLPPLPCLPSSSLQDNPQQQQQQQ